MANHVIRLGDPTSHGGTVVSASSRFNMFGKEIARLGDKVTCPIPGHRDCTIAEGDPQWKIDGTPVALEGHKTTCGAVLISTLSNVTRSYEGTGASTVRGGVATAATKAAVSSIVANGNPGNDTKWIEFRLTEEVSCEGLPCVVHFDDGTQMRGAFDANNEVAFQGVSGNQVERVEFVTDESDSGSSITEALLGNFGR